MLKKKALYLSYTGLLEPLGRSQILAYLSRLSDEYQFTIVSFEKPSDFAKSAEVSALQKECESYGINWQPKIYHRKPRLLATLWDLWVLVYTTWVFSRSGRAELVHCRSYIPTIAAWFVGKKTKVPFVFDMRALWLDEMVSAGRLKPSGFLHKSLRYIEKCLLQQSAHIVSLTEAAVEYLLQRQPTLKHSKFSVITTCVDLDNFKKEPLMQRSAVNYWGTMGTVSSGWYHLDWLFRFFKQVLLKEPEAQFKIVSRDNAEKLLAQAGTYGIDASQLRIMSSSQKNIAQNIAEIQAGLLFFTEGVAKLGSAPTRMGEFLACGIPVVGNRDVGDMAMLIERYQVGVVLDNGSDVAIKNALESLQQLLLDENLAQRCRYAAEDYFSASKGAEKYRDLYKKVVGSKSR